MTSSVQPTTDVAPAPQQVALVDLLDRLLGTGVVLSGDVTISLSGIDLVHVRLYALLASVGAGFLAEDR